jgi:hypothetical protein
MIRVVKPKDSRGRVWAGVSPEDFVRAWQRGDSVQAVADALGMTKQAVSVRAMIYRKKGIPMKLMPRGVPKLDVAALTKIAKDTKP